MVRGVALLPPAMIQTVSSFCKHINYTTPDDLETDA